MQGTRATLGAASHTHFSHPTQRCKDTINMQLQSTGEAGHTVGHHTHARA